MASDLEARIQRMEDVQAIMNLQSKYLFYFGMQDVDKVMACFAKDPRVSSELGDKGKFVGWDNIYQTFQDKCDDARKIPGLMGNIMAINPVIEVNKDGKTAKGLWYAFGPIAVPYINNELTAMWLSGKYDVEYIKEDGEWKFLHLHFILIFRCRVDQDWVKESSLHHNMGIASIKPNDAPSAHQPYDPTIFNPCFPAPPEPVK